MRYIEAYHANADVTQRQNTLSTSTSGIALSYFSRHNDQFVEEHGPYHHDSSSSVENVPILMAEHGCALLWTLSKAVHSLSMLDLERLIVVREMLVDVVVVMYSTVEPIG